MVANVLPILTIECPYRTPLAALFYSFVHGPGRKFLAVIVLVPIHLSMFICDALGFIGLLGKTPNWLSIPKFKRLFRLHPSRHKSLRQAERAYVRRNETFWTQSALSWLAQTTSDPSAKIILVEALGTTNPLSDRYIKPLVPVFLQQWNNISFPDNEPYSDEILVGRLIRSTVSQSYWEPTLTMLRYLPTTPIWVKDLPMVLAIAACRRTPKFHLRDDCLVVLPPYDALGFVLEHYTVFEELAVPLWMWLSICVQAVTRDELPQSELSSEPTASKPLPVASKASECYDAADVLFSVSASGTYNTFVERDRISAWMSRRLWSDDLRRAVDQKIQFPDLYGGRNAPVSLAMFLVVFRSARSLDTYTFLPGLEPPSPSTNVELSSPSAPFDFEIPPANENSLSPSFPVDNTVANSGNRTASCSPQDAVSHSSLLPSHHSSSTQTPSSFLTKTPISRPPSTHLLNTLPDIAAHSSLPSVRHSSVHGNDSADPASSRLLPSSSRLPNRFSHPLSYP
ncbi:hypothetical protein K438DRAFT_1883158 [Mycena galopus ATCC 62051]|nr:hypothetical protein K438DRAFT_1883158 [Mycena galopus ATCC 62051]